MYCQRSNGLSKGKLRQTGTVNMTHFLPRLFDLNVTTMNAKIHFFILCSGTIISPFLSASNIIVHTKLYDLIFILINFSGCHILQGNHHNSRDFRDGWGWEGFSSTSPSPPLALPAQPLCLLEVVVVRSCNYDNT